ncbi:hypothetical protein BGZ94_008910 [Podila epigama]|nr:hypothetical protein BGZ94_008910 [Podila epigama]
MCVHIAFASGTDELRIREDALDDDYADETEEARDDTKDQTITSTQVLAPVTLSVPSSSSQKTDSALQSDQTNVNSHTQPSTTNQGVIVSSGTVTPTTANQGNQGVIDKSGVIDPRKPSSRLSMIQPKASTTNPPLFAIGRPIVFEWQYDNTTLVFPPTNLTIEINLATDLKKIWNVANVPGSTARVEWDSGSVSKKNLAPLTVGMYTVSVYDTKVGRDGVAKSGYLSPFSELRIGLYTPETPIPKTERVYCATCDMF